MTSKNRGTKVLSVLVALVLTVLLAACSTTEVNKPDNNKKPSSDSATLAGDTKTFESYHTMEEFNDGLACVSCSIEDANGSKENKDSFFGYVNKEGDLVFYVKDGTSIFGNNFEDGFVYFQSKGQLYVVDTQGNIRSQYDQYQKVAGGGNSNIIYGDENNTVHCHGYGCVVFKEHIADFSNNRYKYTLYSPDKEVLMVFDPQNAEETEAYYAGDGVFAFYSETDDEETTELYFTQTNKKITLQDCDDVEFVDGFYRVEDKKLLNDEGEYIDINYKKVEKKLSQYADKYEKGKVGQLGYEIFYVSDDQILIYSHKTFYDSETETEYRLPILSYNAETDTLYEYTNADVLTKITGVENFQDGKLVLHLTGADNETYFSILDNQMQEVLAPTKVDEIGEKALSGLIKTKINGETIYYNLDGTIAFEFSDTGYRSIFDFSDGMAMVYGRNEIDIKTHDSYFGEEFAYINTKGEVVFDQIDKTKAKELNIY